MTEGRTDEAKGRVKKAAGELSGNEKLKSEGTVDKASGKLKQGIDKTKEAITGKKH